MTRIRTMLGDITKIDTEAIVNAANNTLLGGGGVDGAIHQAAGPKLLTECRKLNGCFTGEAKITGGYRLPSKYIIHTVGPVWNGGEQNEYGYLQSCYWNSLRVAKVNRIQSIAFPAISTGIYGFPSDIASRIATGTVKNFVKRNPKAFTEIVFVLTDSLTKAYYDIFLSRA